jgi:hypothetical protein
MESEMRRFLSTAVAVCALAAIIGFDASGNPVRAWGYYYGGHYSRHYYAPRYHVQRRYYAPSYYYDYNYYGGRHYRHYYGSHHRRWQQYWHW